MYEYVEKLLETDARSKECLKYIEEGEAAVAAQSVGEDEEPKPAQVGPNWWC